jgi:hypothetical protein
VKNRIEILGVAMGVPAAVLSFIFLVYPQLNPQTEHSGEITEMQVTEYNVTRGQFLGNTYSVRVRIKGFNGKRLFLGYTVRNYEGGAEISGLANQRALIFRPESDDDTAASEVWSPVPAASGTYYVEFVLYDNDGSTVLDQQNSVTFQRSA